MLLIYPLLQMQLARPMPGRGPAPEEKTPQQLIQEAQFIVSATIESFQEGIATMSMPPQCQYQITISGVKALRGTIPDGNDFKLMIVGFDKPITGEQLVLLGSSQDGHFFFKHQLKLSFEEASKIVKANPPGWTNGKSPFTQQFEHPEINVDGASVCPSTKRPSFTLAGFSMKVEQVIPETLIEYTNTYGDGKFTIAITNNGEKQVCPALFQDDAGNVLIEQSLILSISSMGQLTQSVFSSELPGHISQVVFEAGETKTFEINTLKIQGVDWPHGGMRVYMQFILGDLVESNFFYFMTKHHGKLVEELNK